jgi:hypothetical protein
MSSDSLAPVTSILLFDAAGWRFFVTRWMCGLLSASVVVVATLGGCGTGGNLGSSDTTYHGSPATPVKDPKYDPYMRAGDAPATWVAPTYDRHGTIVAPDDPTLNWQWEDYQNAPWFQRLGRPRHPPGTF